MDKVSFTSGDILSKIQEAASEQKLLQITYVDNSGAPSIRTVEPYEIKEGKLFAHCTSRDAIRAFLLDRIQSAEIHLSEFNPRFPILI